MLGHALTTHITNQERVVPLCACGWIGTPTFSGDRARREHDAHVREETAFTPEQLRARAAYVERVSAIIRRPGRFPTA